MNFIPKEYDFHPNEFHTYGMNSVSMTFIPTAVRSSYRECEKTSVIPKLHTALPAMANRVIRSKVQQVGGWKIYLCAEENLFCMQDKACSAAACMMQQWAQETSYACKSITDEIFSVVNKSLSVYPSKGNDNCNISTMVQQTRLACNIACIHVFPYLQLQLKSD